MLFLFLLLPVGLLLTLRGLERYERLLDEDPAQENARTASALNNAPVPVHAAPPAIPAPAIPFVPAVAGAALPDPVTEAV